MATLVAARVDWGPLGVAVVAARAEEEKVGAVSGRDWAVEAMGAVAMGMAADAGAAVNLAVGAAEREAEKAAGMASRGSTVAESSPPSRSALRFEM